MDQKPPTVAFTCADTQDPILYSVPCVLRALLAAACCWQRKSSEHVYTQLSAHRETSRRALSDKIWIKRWRHQQWGRLGSRWQAQYCSSISHSSPLSQVSTFCNSSVFPVFSVLFQYFSLLCRRSQLELFVAVQYWALTASFPTLKANLT